MKMIFHFKALSPEKEDFERDYEIAYDATLLDFHNLTSSDLGYTEDQMASFFTSDASWSKKQEFTSENMYFEDEDDSIEELNPLYMGDMLMGQIIQEKNQKLLYVFDLLSNRGLFINLINTFKSDEDIYPQTTNSIGLAPLQLDEDIVKEHVSEIFDEFEDEFDDYNEFSDEYQESDGYQEEYY